MNTAIENSTPKTKYKHEYNYGVNSICEYIELAANRYALKSAITDEYNGKVFQNYAELIIQTKDFAAGLQGLGVEKGDIIGLFSENNGRWVAIDLGILKCGAIDAVRGSNAPIDEIDYIIGQSNSKGIIVQTKTLLYKLKPYLNKYDLKFIILMFTDNEDIDTEGIDCPVYSFEEIVSLGKKRCFVPVEQKLTDIATLIYTSGTTGNPKGVMLTHGNFIYQIEVAHFGIGAVPGDKTLEILPIWHAYERIGIYYFLSRGCHLHYTTLSKVKDDMTKYSPDLMMSVPRIWEAVRQGIFQKLKQKAPTLYKVLTFAIKLSTFYRKNVLYLDKMDIEIEKYNSLKMMYCAVAAGAVRPLHKLFRKTLYQKIKDTIGLNIKVSVSGGGALSIHDEFFYDAMGINLRVGYGLTETAPVLTLRHTCDKNLLCSAGTPIKYTEIKIIDPETKKELKPYQKGIVYVRGPQVMQGYYNDEKSTKAVLSPDGWFNTGDLGYLTHQNALVLRGRMKETIVLSNGENVEPIPIEDAILGSPYINQIVLVGQDKSAIGALIVPSKEALEKCKIDNSEIRMMQSPCLKNQSLKKLIRSEIDTYIKNKSKLKPFEKIQKFEVLKEGFSIDNGLMTSTAKIKRNKVFEVYNDIINNMYQV